MRRIITVFLIVLLLGSSFLLQAKDAPAMNEISTSLWGLFTGSYLIKYERGLAEGLIGIGPRIVYKTKWMGSTDVNAFLGYLDLRLYPKTGLEGFYFGFSAGYRDRWSKTTSEHWRAIPFLGQIGYKWAINMIGVDLGIGIGKSIQLDTDSSLLPPFDAIFAIGYRF